MNAHWFVVRTTPQQEFAALHALNQWDRAALLPFEQRWIRNSRNKTKLKKYPLMPGYVFAQFNGTSITRSYLDFWDCRRVINNAADLAGRAPPIIGVCGYGQTPSPLPESEIRAIETMSRDAGPKPWENIFTPGQSVRITGTNTTFDGQETKINDVTKSKASVMLKMFNSMMVVEVNIKNIEAA